VAVVRGGTAGVVVAGRGGVVRAGGGLGRAGVAAFAFAFGAGAGAARGGGGGGEACAWRTGATVRVAAGRAGALCAEVVRVAGALATGALAAGAFVAGARVVALGAGAAFLVGDLVVGRSFSPMGTIRRGGALDWAKAAAPPIAMKPAMP
jgi:hypothetical protein